MAAKAENIRILGEGTNPGGIYGKVSIHGQGNIRGDVKCSKIQVFGDSRFNGNTTADQFNLFGSSTVYQELNGKNYKILGSLDVIKKISGETCRIRGWLTSKESIEMEKLNVKGGLTVDGLLNGGEITIKMRHATSRIQEIGGEKITVKSNWLNFFGGKHRLMADVIEGDAIYLEHTSAKIVRGKEIVLGPNCEVGLVEYHTSYKHDKSAKVKEVNKL